MSPSGNAAISELVIPLRGEWPFPMTGFPAAAILPSDPNRTVKPPIAQIKQAFGPTTAEAGFAIEIPKRDGIQAGSEGLKILRASAHAPTTQIFAKTAPARTARPQDPDLDPRSRLPDHNARREAQVPELRLPAHR